MHTDLRRKHDVETRRLAVGIFKGRLGYRAVVSRLSVPGEAVREGLYAARAGASGYAPSARMGMT